jgi:FlaA1/EpsC-like NDP-sugar epimerase
MKKHFTLQNRVFLISGGAGTLGVALAKEIFRHKPAAVRLLDSDENGLFWAEQLFRDEKAVRLLLGDVRDRWRLRFAMENVDVFIHTAALKHVHLVEKNPFEALKVNAVGTQNCIETAIEKNVKKFILISSDKAVDAKGTYGVTKLLSEKLVLDARNFRGDHPTRFVIVRPANFKVSRGSVMELWEHQKKLGKPLTVTDPEMCRYFMDLEDAVKLIIDAIKYGDDGEIYVPKKVEKVRIIDLARKISDNIEIIGKREGESLTHMLMSEDEKEKAVDMGDYWVIKN